MEAKIDIISWELIKPSSPTPFEKRKLKLSFLDQVHSLYFIPLLFLYEKQKPSDSEQANVVDDPSETTLNLKRSLSESLTKFYPLAGKLNADNRSVDCDDSGALFVEAKFDAPFSQEMVDETVTHFLPFEPLVYDNHDKHKPLLATGCPKPRDQILLAVQITRFECGTSVIGVCISHKIADFMSLVTFMNSWAAQNRGESTKLRPNFDVGRELFPPLDHDISFPLVEPLGKIVRKPFVFNKEKLTELKQLAKTISSSASPLEKDPTRVEVLTAFIWSHLMKGVRAKHPGAATLTFSILHLVNLRSRMAALQSNIDDEFPFGNLVIFVPISFAASDDGENHEKRDDYGDLVRHTSNTIREVNEDYVFNTAIPYLQNLTASGGGSTQQPTSPTIDDIRIFISWCRFPVYEMDFGWGKPYSVGPGSSHGQPGDVLFKSSKDGEGIEASITMLEDEFALLPDELLSFAATRFF